MDIAERSFSGLSGKKHVLCIHSGLEHCSVPTIASNCLDNTFVLLVLSASSLAKQQCIYTVKIFGLFQPVKGCLSCTHVQRINDNSIKYHISNN